MALEFQVILYTVVLILLIMLIILCIKMIDTLHKVDKVVDNVNNKLGRVEGLFDIIDATTDAISSLNDKIVMSFYGLVQKIFKRKKEDE